MVHGLPQSGEGCMLCCCATGVYRCTANAQVAHRLHTVNCLLLYSTRGLLLHLLLSCSGITTAACCSALVRPFAVLHHIASSDSLLIAGSAAGFGCFSVMRLVAGYLDMTWASLALPQAAKTWSIQFQHSCSTCCSTCCSNCCSHAAVHACAYMPANCVCIVQV